MERQRGMDAEKDSGENRELAGGEGWPREAADRLVRVGIELSQPMIAWNRYPVK
jgi:hypothetical protein